MVLERTGGFKDVLNSIKKSVFDEIEIILLIAIFAVWYLQNFPGAYSSSDALYADLAHHYLEGDFYYYYGINIRPLPIYFMSLGELLFGQNSFGHAFFSFIFGLLSIYLTYRIGRELGNRFIGFFSAFLIGATPLFVVGAVNVILETPRTFFILSLFYLALRYSKITDIRKKRKNLLLMGLVSACGLLAKQDTLFFITAIVLYLFIKERNHIIGLIRKYISFIKNTNLIKRTMRNHRISLSGSLVFGAMLGLIAKITVDFIWNGLAQERKDRVILRVPPLFRNTLSNPGTAFSWLYFLALGIIACFILWVLYVILFYDFKETLKWFIKPRQLNKVQKIMAWFITTTICILVILLPYLTQPHYLLYRFFSGYMGGIFGGFYSADTPAGGGHLVEIGGELYTQPPLWAYFYWIYHGLGLTYVVGLLLALVYSIYIIATKDQKRYDHYSLFYIFIAIPFLLYHARSVKLSYHIYPLFPLFSIYISTHVYEVTMRLRSKIPQLLRKEYSKYMGAIVCAALLFIPSSPLLTSLSDPDIKTDSGYDTAAQLVIEYAADHPNETITVLAHGSYALEYYMGDDMPGNVILIDRLWGNITEDELYDMVVTGEISLMVEMHDTRTADTPLNRYVEQNALSEYAIEKSTTDTVIYYLQ
jgi:hypothetical protein